MDADRRRQALEFASKQWEAEQENARRLAARANGVLAGVAALSGLGVFKLGDVDPIASNWTGWIVRSLIALAIIFMLIGLTHVWDIRPPHKTNQEEWWRIRRKLHRWVRRITSGGQLVEHGDARWPFSSSWLFTLQQPASTQSSGGSPTEPDLFHADSETLEEIAFYRLSAAAADLHRRNIERRTGLAVGQGWIAWAALCALLAVLAYTLLNGLGDGSPAASPGGLRFVHVGSEERKNHG